ncbi:uncharacterized protein LOC135707576 [Ochlerotatus camptorhynchus]|uniref:uncharacterized protein LOC135707576 n=1 Tax=Ochlerotatus camptorhynchus TaxID=644619 RepID=UPI0031DA6396
MVLVYCVFDKCGNQRKKNSKISFFSFPKEEELLQKWLNFVNKHNPTKLEENLLERDKMKICHMHFEKRQVQTKSNNDRALVRNSVPRCPPGIVDKAHALKKSKVKKKPKKSKAADSGKSRKSMEASHSKPKATQLALEGNPLYHTINGYVVDLRIAAQQDTFRLPNGKLIQVRRQPKKGSDTETDSTTPTDVAKSTAPVSPSTDSTEKPNTETSDKPISAKTATPRSSARKESELPPPPIKAHTEKPSKTYTNRRTLNQPPRTSPSIRSGPLSTQSLPESNQPWTESLLSKETTTTTIPTQPLSPATTPSTPPVTPRQPTATATPSSHPTHTAVFVPPSLSTLQALIHKTHPDTPFGDHLKEFENRLISTAELSLHIVSKINTFLHSNPYRNAEDTRNLKDLYHHVAYILKYAVDRFKGLEDNCIQDIKQMGFTKQSDLGPLLSKQTDKTPPKSSDKEETAVAEAEVEEDDDCAIIEERTDVIEVDSDDEDESSEDEESDDQTAEPAANTLNPKQLRICSDTESIAQDEGSNDSEWVKKQRRKTDSERQAQYESTEQPIENETHTEEATQIEVVMNEVEETTIIQDYYYAEDGEGEDEDGETMEQPNQSDDLVMDLEDDEASSAQVMQEDEEETEELIEIIEGDIDLDLEDGQEYKVIEVIDDDYEMW